MGNDTSDFVIDEKDTSFEDEDEIVLEIQNGNPRAFKCLMKMYFQELAGFANSFVKSPHVAKDIVQDVFANIWERRQSWNPTQSLNMYLYKATKNEALKSLRDQKTEDKYLEAYKDEQDKREVLLQEPDESEDFKQAAHQAIEELPDRARKAYKLHRRDGLTYKEIAQVMEISHKTVESQISRALRILRDRLSSYLPIFVLAILLKSILH